MIPARVIPEDGKPGSRRGCDNGMLLRPQASVNPGFSLIPVAEGPVLSAVKLQNRPAGHRVVGPML